MQGWRGGALEAFIDGDRITIRWHAAAAFSAGIRIRRIQRQQRRPRAVPMLAAVVLVKACAGDEIAGGDELLIMEAMKMELTCARRAPAA